MLQRGVLTEGKLAEQFIAQHLVQLIPPSERPQLNYWLREERSSNAEVDLLIQCEDLIIPIEEKSGESGSMKSLHQFVEKKRSPLAVRFDLGLPNSKDTVHRLSNEAEKCAEFNLLSLPLYMVEQLPRILQATIV